MTTPTPTVIEEARKMAADYLALIDPHFPNLAEKVAGNQSALSRAFIAAIELGERRAEAAVVGWQTIESAPKDRVILVGAWVDGDDCALGSRDIWSQWFTEYTPGSAWPWGCDGTNGDEPTHYREIPTPPSIERGDHRSKPA